MLPAYDIPPIEPRCPGRDRKIKIGGFLFCLAPSAVQPDAAIFSSALPGTGQ